MADGLFHYNHMAGTPNWFHSSTLPGDVQNMFTNSDGTTQNWIEVTPGSWIDNKWGIHKPQGGQAAAPAPAAPQRPAPQPRGQIGMLGGGNGYNRQLENMLSMFLPMMQGRTTGMYGLSGLQMPQQPQQNTFASRYQNQQPRPPVGPQQQPGMGFMGRYGR